MREIEKFGKRVVVLLPILAATAWVILADEEDWPQWATQLMDWAEAK